jgi:hypothetical protein
LLRRAVWQKLTDVTELFTASIIKAIALLMEEASFYENVGKLLPDYMVHKPEDMHLHTHRRDSLKFHQTEFKRCS